MRYILITLLLLSCTACEVAHRWTYQLGSKEDTSGRFAKYLEQHKERYEAARQSLNPKK